MTETIELYGGEVICEFNSVRHSYTIINRGRRYKVPSVTRITSIIDKSGPLMGWAINNTLDVCKGAIAPGCEYAEAYLEAVWDAAKKASATAKSSAASRGTSLHREIESGLKHVVALPEIGVCANSVLAWINTVGTVQAIERRIYSRRYRYSGTFDGLIKDSSGQLLLVDWKSGKSSTYPEYRLQTAAYVHAYEEEFPNIKIAGRYLVRIGEEGILETPHFYPRATLRKDFSGFLGAKMLFDRVQQIEKETRKSLKTKD